MKGLDWRLTCLALLLGFALGGRGAWLWQANTYDKQLAEQAANYGRQLSAKDRDHGREREQAAAAALDQLAEQQNARRDLEGRLQEQNQTHWKEMANAKKTQDRLRDQLATADVRLSVLIDAGAFAAQSCDGGGRETAGTGSLVHGAVRADLDPAHAQRIIGITDEGDRGLIALQACQAYVRLLNR
ncbi:lysis system i-spanin subunit Rz [Pseudomonas monteilii]|uniref:Lysis protein n=1 Tax=Pseudomonas monteilii TaxID=76759 RepID=A0A2N1IME3_9PSED|nr:lysis system i-spanin subunit Rz [Pseudomonas monteilii]PKI19419.1 lysis protein [Pseudomonas monteilii]RPD91903.1 lysis protein [Pseudomonas monteilii]